MRILGLGHSAFLLEIAAPDGDPVRLLVDPWVSDFAVGDLMARFPRLRFDPADLGPLDGIWISHAHTDHLDPESLVRLRSSLAPFPPLILPASLAHLAPLLRERLDPPEIRLLGENEPIEVRGVELRGFFNPAFEASNEDDVMVLLVCGEGEAILSESDAVLPWHVPDLRETLADLLLEDGVDTAAWLTTKNQLDATMSMLASEGREDRFRRIQRVRDELTREIGSLHLVPEDEDDPLDDPRLVRLIGGQGLAAPEPAAALNRILFPITVADRVRMERDLVAAAGLERTIEELVPGQWHEVEEGRVRRAREPALRLVDEAGARRYHEESRVVAELPRAPLRDEARDAGTQAARILAYANERFLPHLVGARNPPVESLVSDGDGEWRIRVRFGTTADFQDRDLRISFDAPRFAWAAPEGDPHEHFFANDVEDVLDGRADEFSTFCRAPLPAPTQHLWLSLGMPWLNPDLVERKLRFHFDRIARGETNADFVLPFWRKP